MPYTFCDPWVLLDALSMSREAVGLLADYRVNICSEFELALVRVTNFGTNRESSIDGIDSKPNEVSRDRLPHLGRLIPTGYNQHLMTRYRSELMLQARFDEV